MLVKVNGSHGETYVDIDLNQIAKIVVDEQFVNRNEIALRDGTRYILRPDEARRVVEARKRLEEGHPD